jgi:hypothetical protein
MLEKMMVPTNSGPHTLARIESRQYVAGMPGHVLQNVVLLGVSWIVDPWMKTRWRGGSVSQSIFPDPSASPLEWAHAA